MPRMRPEEKAAIEAKLVEGAWDERDAVDMDMFMEVYAKEERKKHREGIYEQGDTLCSYMLKAIGSRLDVVIKAPKEVTFADYSQMVSNIEALRPMTLDCPSNFAGNTV